MRLADIFLAVPSDATENVQAETRKSAEAVLAEALEARDSRSGLGSLIKKYSDTPQNYSKGDTGFFDIKGKPLGLDKRMVEAAFKLDRVGSMADQVIESPDGYHIIMLIGKRSAVHSPMEHIRNELKQRIRRETAAKARQIYISNLQEEAEIQIDTKILSGMLDQLSLTASTRQPYPAGNQKSPSSGKMASPLIR